MTHMDYLEACKLAGWNVPEELWDYLPIGHRIMVALLAPKEQLRSGLYITRQAAEHQRLGSGIVIAVGDKVGDEDTWHWPGVWPFPREELLGAEITFGQHVGYALYILDSDDEFHSSVLLLTDCDIHTVKGRK